MKVRGKTKFQDRWRQEFSWVRPVEGNQYAARCILCNYEFVVDTMGRRALQSHGQGKKHISRAQDATKTVQLSSFFTPTLASAPQPPSAVSSLSMTAFPGPGPSSACCTVTSETSSTSALVAAPPSLLQVTSSEPVSMSSSRGNFNKFIIKDNVSKAEILWCLQTINNHLSLRAAESSCSLFKVMFPDCDIAQSMMLHKSKISYVIVYGLAPFFSNILKKKVEICDQFVVGFDESLNKISQRQQMDVNVRFWDKELDKVCTRYLTSVFLEHTTANDLLEALKTALSNFDLKKLLQVSMDGPNVNFKMLKLLKDELAPDAPKLLEMGSCGIHTVHCAFKSGIKGTKWNVIEFLRAIYNLFKDVPSRRGDFTAITGATEFPFKFCAVRWLENVNVASRALNVLPYLEKYVAKVKGTNKEPTCRSFTLVEEGLKDKLIRAKLTFFMALAEEISPFLREFQSDAPLAPFLHSALCALLRNTLTRFVKKELLDGHDLKSIDVSNKDNLMLAKEVDLGYSTRHSLRSCKNVSDREMMQFRQECRTCLQLFSIKLTTRSPLKYPLTKAISCLNPEQIASVRGTQAELSSALDILVTNNRMSGFNADKVAREYKDLCSRPHVVEALKRYTRKETNVDEFWMDILNRNNEWSTLSAFVKMLLILSHGNANLERGFSVNKECLVPNQKERSLIAQRQVIEAIHLAGGVEKIEITKPMILAVRNSHAKYKESVEAQKKEEDKASKAALAKRKAEALVKELEEKKQKLQEETERELALIQEQVKSLKKQY